MLGNPLFACSKCVHLLVRFGAHSERDAILHAAANHSNLTGRRSVHAGPPAPDSPFVFVATIAFPSSFNLWPAIVLDYFTYCEVPLASAHCDAQASERGHAGVSRC